MVKDRHAAAQGIATLLPKLNDLDPDIRYMQLNDLANILTSPASEYLKTSEAHTVARLIDALLKALSDSNGEVQNQALKCVGPLTTRTPGDYVAPFTDKIVDLTKSGIDISIPSTALRTLVAALPQPQASTSEKDVREAYQGISKVLIPRLIGYVPIPTGRASTSVPSGLLQQQKDQSYSSDAVDVLIEVVRCYGSILSEAELNALAKTAMEIIESPQAGGVVKKRALAGIGALVAHFNEVQLNAFVFLLVEGFKRTDLTPNRRRFLISTIGTLARSVPKKIGPHLNTLSPFVLHALSQAELDNSGSDDEAEVDPEIEELREAALLAVDAMIASCPVEMQSHLGEVIDSTLRYVKYDPNIADMDDEEMSGTQDVGSDDGFTEEAQDEDDEYAELDDEDAFSDVDDVSWKVRRCAAKTLHTIISGTIANDLSTLFSKIVPVLIARLYNEREDSVRIEVIQAATALISRTGAAASADHINESNGQAEAQSHPANTRKRRREDSQSYIGNLDFKGLVQNRASPPIEAAAPPVGSGADLAAAIPKIVQAVEKMWKKASMVLKQAAVIMLRTIALSRNGALADHLQQLEDPIADALKPSGLISSSSTSGSSVTTASLQIETLLLISTVAETNGNRVLIPFVIALIPSVTSVVRDRNYKVAVETLATIEQFAKALTPPRLPEANQDHAIHIQKLYEVVIGPVTDVNTGLEIRHRAIQVLGVLIARTSSTGLLSQTTRTSALGLLCNRLRNETTRLESARAIGLIAEAARPQDNIGSEWVREVALEMANQLRKVDRALRASCLESLQYLALNPLTSSQLDTNTIQELQLLLLPLVSTDDLHMLTPALVILARIIPTNAQTLVTDEVVRSLCSLTHVRLEGPPLKAYLLVMKVIGEQGVSIVLMKGLLAIGTAGDTMVLGRAIGTLIVFGGPSIGVSVPDFLTEIEGSADVQAKCLALTVLGEVGLRMGGSSPLGLDVFIKSLSADSEKVRLAAAVALGSASSSNIPKSLPLLLQSLGSSPGQDYLYLHAIKEILQHSESAGPDVAPYASQLWQTLFTVADHEDNRAVAAECLGRLATIEPSTYVTELSRSLESDKITTRGIVISAFRFTLSDNSRSYNAMLGKVIVDMLKKMLGDVDIGNRRLAVTTLNAAIHNKPELIIPDIGQLLPIILAESHVKPELIKTVKIGPFTHQEDSGLDLRKAAYSTMYTLVDQPKASSHLPISAIFDRILDGVPDDNDIRALCHLMIQRLITIDPSESRRRLSPLADKFKIVLSIKLKENAVKQEIEKLNEANAAVIRITLELERAFPAAASGDTAVDRNGWKAYLEWVKKEFASVVRNIANENQ